MRATKQEALAAADTLGATWPSRKRADAAIAVGDYALAIAVAQESADEFAAEARWDANMGRGLA